MAGIVLFFCFLGIIVMALASPGFAVMLVLFVGWCIYDWMKDAPKREEEKKRREEEKRKFQEELEASGKRRMNNNTGYSGSSSSVYHSRSYTSSSVTYSNRTSSASSGNPYSPPSSPTVDTNRLRNDMMDHYGSAVYSGFPMAQADLIHVQRASDAELIREAQKSGFDLNKYME